jgi:hypothetical protein
MKNLGVSMLCRIGLGIELAAAGAGLGTPVLAQDKSAPVVKATDAPGLLAVLKQAGYDAKLNPREGEESSASIAISTRDGEVFVQFSDCDDAVPDFCETLVLSTSWNRTTLMSDNAIAEANCTFKYVSIWRDEDGDPVMQWAILTRDTGLPPPLFLNALQRYLEIVRDFDEIAFEGDEAAGKVDDALSTT